MMDTEFNHHHQTSQGFFQTKLHRYIEEHHYGVFDLDLKEHRSKEQALRGKGRMRSFVLRDRQLKDVQGRRELEEEEKLKNGQKVVHYVGKLATPLLLVL